MGYRLSIPHRRAPGMCPVNGVRDLVHWRSGRDWSNEFVHGLGQGGGFAYLRFKSADPPRQVYWGVAGPRQHEYLAGLLDARYSAIENRSFKFAWNKACQAVDAATPPVLGPLDMFYLHYYLGIYGQRHIPIHYVLLVGYDEERAHVHDTDQDEVQSIPLGELQLAWDVNVPGLGKRHRLAIFDIPEELAPTEALIRTAIADQCRTMLRPPVSMVGSPAMKKLAREIAGWPEELGEEAAAACLRQVREYLNSPPDLAGDHLTAGRDLYITFLQEAGAMAGLDFSEAMRRLGASMAIIPPLAEAIRQGRLEEAAAHMRRIAEEEVEAYTELSRILGVARPATPGF
jgi:hypothetical protein